jgi:transposase
MMPKKFLKFDRQTLYFMPPSIQDWLPEKHLASFVAEIVSHLDLRPLKDAYVGSGSKPYHPEMLLSLLFYGYATGVYSSRKIEIATYEMVPFRFLAANTHPDHDTIATFRKRFLEELKPLFVQILMIAHQMGVLKLGKISLDGTKIKANASRHKALSWDYACKLEKQLKEEIKELMRLAEKADAEELPDGLDIPDELSRRKERIVAIAKAKEEIERRAAERYAREKEAYDQKIAERKAKEEKTGKKPGGRTPKQPEPGPLPNDQVNLTDEESRVMPSSGKGFEQAYNAQAGVDIDSMLIVEGHITQNPNDKQEIEPALQKLSSLPEEIGKVDAILADTGYFSESNANKCISKQVTPYIAGGRSRHNQALRERFFQPSSLPEDADSVAKMKHRLQTMEGRQLYAKRKSTVEPVFGIIKNVMGFRQFLLRGLTAVTGEWNIVCIAWNLKRMHTLMA